jgi:hypothetical protein
MRDDLNCRPSCCPDMRGYPSRSDFKVEIGGGTLAAISAILGSLIEPTPDGMAATRPSASAPAAMARRASSTDAMQQTLIRSLMANVGPSFSRLDRNGSNKSLDRGNPPMSLSDQNAKYSMRADVYCSTPNDGHPRRAARRERELSGSLPKLMRFR